MKVYSDEQAIEIVKQAVELKIPLYGGDTIGDIEVLVNHALRGLLEREIPKD